MTKKEQSEGTQLRVFINLFNKKYNTDYKIGSAETENSIVDRKAISTSKKWKDFGIQLKDVKELDRTHFTRMTIGEGTKVFNLNIFKLLTPLLEKVEKRYKGSTKEVVMVFNVGVSEDWMRDYVQENKIETSFEGVYCLGLPSIIPKSNGYIFPMKEIKL